MAIVRSTIAQTKGIRRGFTVNGTTRAAAGSLSLLSQTYSLPQVRSALVFCSKEDRDAKEAVQTGRDCRRSMF
jgi:hypothetical protein